MLSGVLARLAEPGTPRALDDAGASIAKCLAILYPARAGLERELEAAGEGDDKRESGSLRAPLVELPARAASPAYRDRGGARADASAETEDGDEDDEPERGGRPKRRTSPGVAPPSSPMIPLAQLMQPEVPTSIARRTLIRGTDESPARTKVAPASAKRAKKGRPASRGRLRRSCARPRPARRSRSSARSARVRRPRPRPSRRRPRPRGASAAVHRRTAPMRCRSSASVARRSSSSRTPTRASSSAPAALR